MSNRAMNDSNNRRKLPIDPGGSFSNHLSLRSPKLEGNTLHISASSPNLAGRIDLAAAATLATSFAHKSPYPRLLFEFRAWRRSTLESVRLVDPFICLKSWFDCHLGSPPHRSTTGLACPVSYLEMRGNRTQTIAVADKRFLMVGRQIAGLQDSNIENDRPEQFHGRLSKQSS
ncbi:hypothetical protein Acr_10g0001880 [Actinidia rufa]|uniref:Uncharacterized protein n=1 Tax=Actinidia rufa TaxID=165716 RepID=A0A7J0F875_9ERIC|nr:hypothetical protein Acr_10g0001880 [Actinidia rufa]